MREHIVVPHIVGKATVEATAFVGDEVIAVSHLAFDVAQNLSALVVEAQRPGRALESFAFEMAQEFEHRRRHRPAAAPNGRTDAHDGRVRPARERYFGFVHRAPVWRQRGGAFGRIGGVAEESLEGGIANAGQVVRDGPHVLRPASPHTASIHAFLRAVRATGFAGAPIPVGVDDDGRERLEFIEGDVPVPPYPDWSQSDAALASLARLLRGLHDAARTFDPSRYAWSDALADPAKGPVVCHNDVELSNVVFRNGVAVAFIDFEFAAPGRPIYDLAQLARLCVPIDAEQDRARMGWRSNDQPARLRMVADAYGLDLLGRAELPAAIDDALTRVESAVRRSVDTGDPNYVELWDRTGGQDRFDRRRRWWADHRAEFAAALR
jgi:hypothetical protein